MTCVIEHGRDVVVDVSFWQRMARDRYKRVVEDTAFPITDEILSAYLSGFEAPSGEGEEVVTLKP